LVFLQSHWVHQKRTVVLSADDDFFRFKQL
jgi:hypothetical protein